MKRKPRNKMSKKVDLTKPVTIEQLGTKDDPCFGKHYSITAPECQRCGDSELCSIVKAQKNHLKREKIEQQNNFKDLEKPKVMDKGEIRKRVVARILELVKGSGKNGISYDIVLDDIKGAYSKFDFSLERLNTILRKTIKSNSLTHKNSKIKCKQKT
jgi:hypothetical protein